MVKSVILRVRQPHTGHTLGLPQETLLYIFKWAVALRYSRLSCFSAPMNISQTCRYWRDIALSNGSLWARIDIYCYYVPLAPMWLRRAGHSLLDINFRLPFISCASRSAVEKWHKAVVSKQMLWRNMVMYFVEDNTVKFQPAVLHDLSNLKRWEIGCRESFVVADASPVMEAPFPIFLVPPFESTSGPIAPKLTSLSIRMTECYFEQKSMHGLMAMLQHSPNLKELYLGMNGAADSGANILFDSFQPIHLIHLIDLKITGVEVLHLFFHFIAPALERLMITTLNQEQQNHNIAPRALESFLRNSGASRLTTVSIDYKDVGYELGDMDIFEEEQYMPILRAISNVTDLTLRFPCGDLTCGLLALPNGPDEGEALGLCPQLTRLEMTVKRHANISALRRLLSSRFDQPEEFFSILHFEGRYNTDNARLGFSPQDIWDFKDWESEGRLEMHRLL